MLDVGSVGSIKQALQERTPKRTKSAYFGALSSFFFYANGGCCWTLHHKKGCQRGFYIANR